MSKSSIKYQKRQKSKKLGKFDWDLWNLFFSAQVLSNFTPHALVGKEKQFQNRSWAKSTHESRNL